MISTLRIGLASLFVCIAVSKAQAATSLSFGVTYSGSISVPGETNAYTFTGVPGQRLYYDALEADGAHINVSLLSPGGLALYQNNDDYDSGLLVLTQPGTYSLVFYGSLATTGNFQFRLLDLSAAPTLTLGTTLSDQLAPPLACNIYQFNGTHGQRVNLQSLAYSTNRAQWQLVSPANVILVSGQINQNLGTLTLPVDGPYCLMVIGTTDATQPLTFQVGPTDVSDAPAVAAGFGTQHSGTVNANATNTFTYTAPAGLPVYFDSLDSSGRLLEVDLLDPNGITVFAVTETSDAGPFILPRSGTYTLNVRGPGGGSGNFNFRLLDLTTSPVLPLSTVVSNTLALPYQTDVYQLAAAAGQRLLYDSQLSSGANIQLQLFGPDLQSDLSGNSSYDYGPVTLPFSGTYYFVQQSPLATSPSYVFQMIDIGTQPALPLNTDLTGTLSPYQSLVYQVAGTQGEQLYFNGKGVSAGGAAWTLYDPRNTGLAGGTQLGGDFVQILPYSGNYVLILANAANLVSYTNQVNTFAYPTNALTLGASTTGTIAHPGDQPVYTFAGTAGQRVFYDSLNPTPVQFNVTLVSPTGITLFSGNASYDVGPVTLPATGVYVLQFSPNGHATGGFTFQLLDLAAQPALPLNTDLTGTLPANTALMYRLTGTAGELLYFNGKGGGGGATWTLYGPNNAYLNSTTLSQDFPQTLPYAGDYALVFQGAANSVSYSNQVNSFSYSTNPMTLGSEVTTTIAHPGDQLYYAFNGMAGQRLYFDSRQTNTPNFSVSLISPAGATVFSGNSSYDLGPLTLTQTGTYSLVLSGAGHTVGTIAFNLLDLSAATLVTVGSTINDLLSDQTETRLYQFAGTAGQRINLQSIGTSSIKATWQLIGLQDQPLAPASTYISTSLGIVTLPVTGNYIIEVMGIGSALSPVPYQLSLIDVSDSPVASSGFGTVHSGNIAANQTNGFTYTGAAGLPVFFDSQDTSGQSLVIDLIAPDGSLVFTIGEINDGGPYVLPRSGTYTLNVRGPNGASGNYSFRLLDLSASPPLSLNTPITGSLNNPYETDVYQFPVSNGQPFIYNGLATDANYPSVLVQLLDPRWQVVGVNGDFQANHGPFAIQYSGTCYLSLRNYRNVASPFSFQLLDVSTQPILPTTTFVTNTLGVYPLQVYRFTGKPGQQIFFQGQPSNPGGSWVLYDPNNNPVPAGSAGLTGSFEVTLQAGGLYALVLANTSGTAGTNIFEANNFSYATNSYTLGSAVVDSLTLPGERHFYTFNGTVSQRLIYNALTNDLPYPDTISVQLLNPQGLPEGPLSGRFGVNRGPFALQQSGTYTLMVDGNGAATGPVEFQLLGVSSAPMLPLSTGVTNTLGVFPIGIYQYPGVAGQHLYFHGLSTNPYGNWNLFDPNNNLVGSAGLVSDFQVALAMTGTYVLVLANQSAAPATETFQVNLFNSDQVVSTGLQILSIQIGPGTATPIWRSTSGKHYRLEYKNNLEDPAWTAVGADVTATDVTSSQQDAGIGLNATRYYRVHSLD